MSTRACKVCGQALDKSAKVRRISKIWPPDVVATLSKLRPNLQLTEGDRLCAEHLENRASETISKKNPPRVRSLDGLAWSAPSSRPLVVRRSPAPKRKIPDEAEELRKRVRELEEENSKLKGALMGQRLAAVIDSDAKLAQWVSFLDGERMARLRILLDGWMPTKATSSANNTKFNKNLLFDAFLCVLKGGQSLAQVADMAQVQPNTMRKWFDKTAEELYDWAGRQIHFLSPAELLEEQAKLAGTDFESYLVMYVDGTLIPLFTPQDKRLHRQTFSDKHGINGWTFFALVTTTGRCVAISDLKGGRVNDKSQWDESDIVERLDAFYTEAQPRIDGVRYTMALCGDKAYVFMRKPDGWKVIVTKSAEKTLHAEGVDDDASEQSNQDPRLKDVILTPAVAVYRSCVERFFARVKRFKGLANPQLLRDRARAKRLVTIAAALVNYDYATSEATHF